MSLSKKGSPTKLNVVKKASFVLDENFLAQMIFKQVPSKKITMDQLHSALKSIGVINYSSSDLDILMDRLQAIGFVITK